MNRRSSHLGPTVVVTDAGTACGVAMIRDLADHGFRVVAVDTTRASAGLWSRSTAERRTVPSFEHDPRAVDAVLDVASRCGADLLVPATEKAAVALDARRSEVESVVPLALAASPALSVAVDKERTLQLARRLGVPTPRSVLAGSTADVVAATRQVGWPAILKPRSSHVLDATGAVTQRVSLVSDDGELAAALAAGASGPPCLVQAFVPGVGVGVEALLSEGRVLAAFQHRRIREVPVAGGMSAFRVSEELDPVLLDHATRLLGALSWTGLAMVEFRVGPGGPVLMEINGRPWGSMALAVRAGMPFPSLLVSLFLDGPPPPGSPVRTDYRRGLGCRNLALELQWAASVLATGGGPLGGVRREDAVPVLLGAVDPRNEFDVQTFRDPVPGVLDALRAVSDVTRWTVGRARARHEQAAALPPDRSVAPQPDRRVA